MKPDLFVIWVNVPHLPTRPHGYHAKTKKTLCGLKPVGYYEILTENELPTKADIAKTGYKWRARARVKP